MGEEGPVWSRFRNAVSGVSGLMPGCPLVRKGDGGVALSENLCDSIHSGRQLFRLLLGQVLTETGMESPARLHLFALDARHHADKLNIGPGGAPWAAARSVWVGVGCDVCRNWRSLPFKDSEQGGNHGGDTEGGCGNHFWVSGRVDRAGHPVAEISVQIVLRGAVFRDQEPITLVR